MSDQANEYVPYGPEWEAKCMRQPKTRLVKLLRDALAKRNTPAASSSLVGGGLAPHADLTDEEYNTIHELTEKLHLTDNAALLDVIKSALWRLKDAATAATSTTVGEPAAPLGDALALGKLALSIVNRPADGLLEEEYALRVGRQLLREYPSLRGPVPGVPSPLVSGALLLNLHQLLEQATQAPWQATATGIRAKGFGNVSVEVLRALDSEVPADEAQANLRLVAELRNSIALLLAERAQYMAASASDETVAELRRLMAAEEAAYLCDKEDWPGRRDEAYRESYRALPGLLARLASEAKAAAPALVEGGGGGALTVAPTTAPAFSANPKKGRDGHFQWWAWHPCYPWWSVSDWRATTLEEARAKWNNPLFSRSFSHWKLILKTGDTFIEIEDRPAPPEHVAGWQKALDFKNGAAPTTPHQKGGQDA